MSDLELLPREIRREIFKLLTHLPDGLPLLIMDFGRHADDPEERTPEEDWSSYQAVVDLTQTRASSCLRDSLDAFAAIRAVNQQFCSEMLEDQELFDTVHMTITRRSSLGNGPSPDAVVECEAFLNMKHLTITAKRSNGLWVSMDGGPDLKVQITTDTMSTSREDYTPLFEIASTHHGFRVFEAGTTLANDEASKLIASNVNTLKGQTFNVNRLNRLLYTMDKRAMAM